MDGCIVEGPLSITFSDIYMVKMENDVVIPSKPTFYCRFVHGIYSRRKLGDNVLFGQLNSYHRNSKLTIEVNHSKFLDTKLTNMVLINSTFFRKTQNYLHHGPRKLQNAVNKIQSMVIFIVQKEYHQILTKKSL